jgi:hypothetical protein
VPSPYQIQPSGIWLRGCETTRQTSTSTQGDRKHNNAKTHNEEAAANVKVTHTLLPTLQFGHAIDGRNEPEKIEQRDHHSCKDARDLSVGKQRGKVMPQRIERERYSHDCQQELEERLSIRFQSGLGKTMRAANLK